MIYSPLYIVLSLVNFVNYDNQTLLLLCLHIAAINDASACCLLGVFGLWSLTLNMSNDKL